MPAPQRLFPPPHPFPSGRPQWSVTWCLLAGADGGSVVLCCSVSAPALGGCWSLCLGSWVFSNRDLRVWIQLLPWEFRLSSLPFLQRQCVFTCALGVKVLLACPQWLNALCRGEKIWVWSHAFPTAIITSLFQFWAWRKVVPGLPPCPVFHECLVASCETTGWDMGPLVAVRQCLSLDTPLSKQQNTKKLYGTKNNCKVVRAGSEQKIQRYNCQVWRTGAKTGYYTPPKGWASHAPSLTPGHTTRPILGAGPAQGAGSKRANLLFFLAPLCCNRDVDKASPEFRGKNFISFYWLWKILKEMGIPDHLTCLLRNLYAGQEATVRTGHWTTDWFQIGKTSRLYIITLLI